MHSTSPCEGFRKQHLVPALARHVIPALLLFLTIAWAGQAEEPSVRLWPGRAPGETQSLGEPIDQTKPTDDLVANRRVIRLGNVSDPEMTFYPAPADRNTGTTVVIFPGGGYHILAMDLEGTEVAEWLNSIGVNACVVQYRVPRRAERAKHAAPLEDAQRAIGLVRAKAAGWKIAADRIGVLGFSAGGHLAAAASTNHAARNYEPQDNADQLSCRPDFAILIYPGYLLDEKDPQRVAEELPVAADTPPTFLVMTQDDPVDGRNVLVYAALLHQHRVPYELHQFPEGGHGYGLRRSPHPVTTWPSLAADWLKQRGLLEPPR
jgi:acetyl esterase/lipase